MKTIKLKFVGFWPGFNYRSNIFTDILEKYFIVEISENPDYIICSVLGHPYEETNYDCVRIFYSGENSTPDFNIHDYAISYNEMQFADRYLRHPVYMMYLPYLRPAEQKHLNITNEILQNKTHFCNYIYGDGADREFRIQAFNLFNTYKKVMSPGIGLNNMPHISVIKSQDEKIAFQNTCKFSIAFDSISEPGFVTEKILHAFAARTVPVYFGDPHISNQFNPKSFINVSDFSDLNSALEKVIELDNNDSMYLEMLQEPAFITQEFVREKQTEFENFLVHIFEQETEKAYRRSRIAWPEMHKNRLIELNRIKKMNSIELLFYDFSKLLSRLKSKMVNN